MRFGTFVPQGWRLDLMQVAPGHEQYRVMRECALRAERAGYHSLWLYDHFHTVPDALPEACSKKPRCASDSWTKPCRSSKACGRWKPISSRAGTIGLGWAK